jgi:hypothetical protein
MGGEHDIITVRFRRGRSKKAAGFLPCDGVSNGKAVR